MEPLWDPIDRQAGTLLGLLAQTPQASDGVWLSQIILGIKGVRYDGIPSPDTLNFPAAARALAADGKIEILEVANRRYSWGEYVFGEDVRLRLKNAK